MKKVVFIIVALFLMAGIVSGDISSKKVSPAPSPIKHYSSPPQSEAEMPPTMPDDYISPSPTSEESPKAGEVNNTDVTGTEGDDKSSGGGKKAGIAVGAIAAASMVGVGGYVLKKRRENIRRRSRYEYAATEIF
ncbi:hypothetical protein EUTSA_v10015987mg [Eutrema salsugineum]|uniref:Uncharacterized protein n=2 Tax=Eutrema salsugineum TaxID=72664 RepID=V4N947_EUTSA|nr:hypothetical protein EUTSA_v10015987mg [Eutrema salsugineum]